MNYGRVIAREKPLFFILLVSTALVFTRFALLAFLSFLAVIAIRSATAGARHRLAQLIWVYIFFFCFLTLFAALWSIFNLRITPVQPLIGLAIASWTVAIRFPKRAGRPPAGMFWPGLLAGLAVVVYVSLPVILHPSSATVLRYSAKTTDDISHIARIEAIRSLGGLLYQKQAAATRLIDPGTAVSPQGWHVNCAYIESLIIKLKGSDTVSTRLFVYLLYKTLWLFITVFLLYSLLETVRSKFNKPAGRLFGYLSIVGTAAVSVLLLVSVFGYGFQNFIASIGLVGAALIVAIQSAESRGRRQLDLFFLAVLTVVALNVWTLAGGIVGLIALAVLARNLSVRYGRALSWRQLAPLGALILLAAFPVYELVRFGSERGLKTINAGGATPPLSVIGVIIIYALAVAGLIKLKPKRSKWMVSLLSLAGLGFIGLAVYQLISAGETLYYGIKLGFLFAAVSAMVLLAVAERFLSNYKKSPGYSIIAYLVILALLPVILGLDLRKSAYPLKNSAPITTATAQKILILSSFKQKNVVIYTPNKEETFLANKLWSSIRLYNTKDRKALLQNLSQQVSQ